MKFKRPLRLQDIDDVDFIRAITQPVALDLDEVPCLRSGGDIDDDTFIRGLTDPSLLNLNDKPRQGPSLSHGDQQFVEDLSKKITKHRNEKTRLVSTFTAANSDIDNLIDGRKLNKDRVQYGPVFRF